MVKIQELECIHDPLMKYIIHQTPKNYLLLVTPE